ncbi:hypothetical protein SprV_0100232700 [Sparganum proliferum]
MNKPKKSQAAVWKSMLLCMSPVVGEEKFTNGSCGCTRLKVHPPVIEDMTVRPVGDAEPKVFVAIHEGRVDVGPLLLTLLLQLVGDEYHVRGPTMPVETILAFSEEGTAIGVEKRCGTSGWRTVNNLDLGEETIPFFAVRVTLELLGLGSCQGVLHLPQPLLHKTAATVEGCFVVVVGAVDIGFAQAVLLSGHVADGCVVVVKPVLVLAACTTIDGQRRRLRCAPQLTPSAHNGGVLVSGGGDDSGGSEWMVD